MQTAPWLALLVASASLSMWYAGSSDQFSPAAALFACLYCTQANFLINAMHELGHGFVFRTKFLNAFFMRIVAFLGWLHPDMFFSSHLRHHRFTQNPPLDLENPPPIRITMRDFFLFGFLNVKVPPPNMLPWQGSCPSHPFCRGQLRQLPKLPALRFAPTRLVT